MDIHLSLIHIWNEIRISANITSYLSGYNDPRLAKYASEADASIGGGHIGVRNGIYQSATTQANYTKFSLSLIHIYEAEDKSLYATRFLEPESLGVKLANDGLIEIVYQCRKQKEYGVL